MRTHGAERARRAGEDKCAGERRWAESPFINAAQIARRGVERGHEVPIGKITSRYERSMANSSEAARISERAYFYDNTAEDRPARLIFRCTETLPCEAQMGEADLAGAVRLSVMTA